MYLPVIADGDGPAMDDVRALKTRLLQFPLSQLRLHPDTASPAYPKLTRTVHYQNAQAPLFNSCP